jgi:small subunit ribosomal protein S1
MDMFWGRVNHPSEMFEVGDEIDVMILKFDPKSERVSLGLKQVSEDLWVNVTERYRIGERLKGKVVSLTDYGSFIELENGIEGLIHVSEMSWTKRVKHPSQIVAIGDIVESVILDIDMEAKRISLGMKQIEENPWVQLQERYPVGSVVRGKIRNITNFGVFIGIEEGIDGLIHISDLDWSGKVKNPATAFEKGDELEAVVLHIDVEKERFSLGIKQLSRDPWEHVEERFPLGTVVEGAVTKLLDFGAIIEIDGNIEGLVHISELSYDKVDAVGDIVKAGDMVRAKVISLIPQERKIGLSLKRLTEEEASAEYSEYLKQQRAEQTTTLGDVFGNALSALGLEGEDGSMSSPSVEEAPAPATFDSDSVEEEEIAAAAEEEATAAEEEAPAAEEEAPAEEEEAPAAEEEAPAAEEEAPAEEEEA